MDLLMIVMRILHVGAGIFWVGAAIVMLRFITPTIRLMGAQGVAFFDSLMANTPYGVAFPIASLTTVLSGLVMYWKVSDGFDADWMETTNAIVLSIGAVAGLLAFGHGGASLGPTTSKFAALQKEIGGGTPTPQQAAMQQELLNKLSTHGQISLILLIIAYLGMATWRYW